MRKKKVDKLISDSLAIESREAKEAGALGYIARALVQATLPHSKVEGNEFKRKNGFFKLTIIADSEIGLPYGSIPRLLVAWLTTEAVRTKNREIILGETLTEFMANLDLVPTGGKWGTITRLREQIKRLFASAISCTYDDGNQWAIKNVNPVSSAHLWWSPENLDKKSFESKLVLGEEFFKEIINHPIPIDIDVIKSIKGSPMALDIYCWLTYRISYLKKDTTIPWELLENQFGSSYSRTRDFKKYFLLQLRSVITLYSEAKLDVNETGIILKPSKTHIPLSIK